MAKTCKYYVEQQLISYDCGVTWWMQDVFRKGDLYETNSRDCGFELIYRWALSENDYECESVRKYNVEVLQFTTEAGGDYQNVEPAYKKRADIAEYLSEDCGYEESTGGFKFSGTSVIDCGNGYSDYGTEYLSRNEIVDRIAPHSIVGDCTEVIGESAFSGSVLTQVDISSYVKEIKSNAFEFCSGLTGMVIPDTVEKIGAGLFSGCINLTGATLPSGLYYIPPGTFNDTAIENYVVPNGIMMISDSAFSRTTGETPLNISFPQTLTDLGSGVFNNRTLPSGFTLPESVKYIRSFDMPVDGLELPPYLEHLGGISEIHCREGLVVPGTVKLAYPCGGAVLSEGTEMGGCKDLPNSINFASGGFNEFGCEIRIRGPYTSRAYGESIFPPNVQVVGGYHSTSGVAIFTFKSTIPPHITLPENTMYVFVPDASVELYKAMWYNFEQYIYPLSYKQYDWRPIPIEDGYECVGVDKHYREHKFISLDSGQTWYDTCISRAGDLYEVNSVECGYVPQNSILTLSYNDGKPDSSVECNTSTVPVNSGDTTIEVASIGECARVIPESCFNGCGGMTAVYIQNGVTEIGSGAFNGCSALTTINIPASVTTIADRPFNGCSGLPVDEQHLRYADTFLVEAFPKGYSYYTIKNGTKWIGGGAFYESHISEITIPNSVIRIGTSAFYHSGLGSLSIGNGVVEIAELAFADCRFGRSIVIPDNVITIGTAAFEDCEYLREVTIGNGVKSIGFYAFMNCRTLRKVTITAIIPPTLGNGAFENTNNCPIYVPAESVDAYKSAWGAYSNRIREV